MTRLGSFERRIDRSVSECEALETDTLAHWRHTKTGETVTIVVTQYPTREIQLTDSGVQTVRVASYSLVVRGTDVMDGTGPVAPFDGVHETSKAARATAWQLMHDLAYQPLETPNAPASSAGADT